MGELGYLDDDSGAYLGMLDMQMMSAVNVALDIGVHLELEIPRAPAGGRALHGPGPVA
jgi:hypothetical protein